MLISLRSLRQLITEAHGSSAAVEFSRNVENELAKLGVRVSTNVDSLSGTASVFIRSSIDDKHIVLDVATRVGELKGWSLLSARDKEGIGSVLWFEPVDRNKKALKLGTRTLWHITPTKNVPSIMKSGLLPMRRTTPGTSRTYEPRVYLATDRKAAIATVNSTGDWTLLSVNVDALPKNTKFYSDVEFSARKDTPNAVYTTSSIAPSAITVHDSLNL